MYTFGQLKTELRALIWPTGEAENLVPSHDRSFLDALIDLQTWVDCQQQDNTQIVPHCATFYNCGLTVLEAPRGAVHRLTVIDKINPTTGVEDATAADDWCSAIEYQQVDQCLIDAYMTASKRCGCCLPLFFGPVCNTRGFPTPTDEGLPAGLAPLPLGYHYPQTSTDAHRRSRMGVWAIKRGKIYIFPYIQSTETVVVEWDGIKREWTDADQVDTDPLFKKAVRLYVQAQHQGEWEHEHTEEANFERKYNEARADLIHQCREETRTRECEPSQARGAQSITTLFYNDSQSATAHCEEGTTGTAVTVTIPAGTVASAISKADANQTAKAQALVQATAQLDCETTPVTYTNTEQTAVASCTVTEGSPPPEGNPVTRTVPAGQVTSSVSQADANAQALALAQSQADDLLSCTYWNSEQTYTAVCEGVGTDVTKTVAAHTYSSTVSQANADAQALNAAKLEAEAELPSVCTGAVVFLSTQQIVSVIKPCIQPGGGGTCQVVVTCTVAAGISSSNVSQADANQQANNLGRALATSRASLFCVTSGCGSYSITFP